MNRSLVLFLALGIAVAFVLAPHWPREQSIHFVLPRAVVRLDVRYVDASSPDEVVRAATFVYAPGAAPRIVTHEPRLANGDYLVQTELEWSAEGGSQRASGERRVTLEGGTTAVDLSRLLPVGRAGPPTPPGDQTTR